MKITSPEKRLKQFWGKVDRKHISSIARFVKGENVLDLGCGLGTTTKYLSDQGFNCFGIDYDADTIQYCATNYPNCKFQQANAEVLPFQNVYFDTIVLRDALHHFYGEANFEKVKSEIMRVLKPGGRIIFFDPNVNLLLKTMRKLAAHKDEECNYETALKIVIDLHCKVIHKEFNTVYSLPLSGGYVGLNFVPDNYLIQTVLLRSETLFEKLFRALGLGRQLCWRYLIVGDRV